MSTTCTMNMTSVYWQLLDLLLNSTMHEVNQRTGVEISMLRGGYCFKLDLADGRLPVQGLRKTYPKTAAAELAWFLQGDKSVRWLERHTKIWSKFVEDDGHTVLASYGYRWRRHFGRDQILGAVSALSANPTDRRVFVSAWDPAGDGLGEQNQRNVPCPVGFTFSVTGGEMHSSLVIRSSDVFVGLPYDVMGHAMLMQVVAASVSQTLGRCVRPGTMTVTLAHPHLYACHYEFAREALYKAHEQSQPLVALQPHNLWHVEDDPDAFVQAYADEAGRAYWPSFDPRPELVL